jgi:hypothetical protein
LCKANHRMTCLGGSLPASKLRHSAGFSNYFQTLPPHYNNTPMAALPAGARQFVRAPLVSVQQRDACAPPVGSKDSVGASVKEQRPGMRRCHSFGVMSACCSFSLLHTLARQAAVQGPDGPAGKVRFALLGLRAPTLARTHTLTLTLSLSLSPSPSRCRRNTSP